jgi:hypothetical protein
MTLGTFGAIMGFAAQIVGQTEESYKTSVQKAKGQTLREALQGLLQEEGKNRSLMEQIRRENVTEMILEPVTGLNQEDYEMNVKVQEGAQDADILKMVISLEAREKKFFQDASAKVPLPEVSRTFRKIAQRKEKNILKLNSLDPMQ